MNLHRNRIARPARNACAGPACLLAAVLLRIVSGSAWAATAYPGYTFCASGSTAYLLNASGTSVHTWKASSSAQTCAYLLPDGSALFPLQNPNVSTPKHDGAYPSGRFQIVSWDGAITWDYYFSDSTARPGYDIEPMPNGNILVPADSSSIAKIIEIQRTGATTGAVVWQYTLPSTLTGGSTYINGVKYNPDLDQIVVDLQDPQRKIVVIDHSGAGSVLYTYTAGASGRVHGAAWVTPYFLGTNIEVPFANRSAMRLNNALVVYNGGDKAMEVTMSSGTLVKSLSYAFSDHEGSIQRLPNSNTLVTPGGSKTITELSDTGTTVATIQAPGSVQRAYRYGLAYPGVSRLVGSRTLTVASAHGAPSPSGTTTNAYGALIEAHAAALETIAGSTRYANSGWTLSGGLATNLTTSGATTNTTLWVTNNTTLTWLWTTNYWLATATNGSGTLTCAGGSPGWNPPATSVTLTATPAADWEFTAWSGNMDGCAVAGTQLTAPMTRARTIAGTFARTPTNPTPAAPITLRLDAGSADAGVLWFGAANLQLGTTVALLRAASLLDGSWETGAPFVVTATNWTVPILGSNAFYRVRVIPAK